MAVTKDEIRNWLDLAKEKGASHMIVVWDSFSDIDYPAFVLPGEDVNERMKDFAPEGSFLHANLIRLMEVYDLNLDLESQLSETRAMHPSVTHPKMTPFTFPYLTIQEYFLAMLKKNPALRPIDLAHIAGLDHDGDLLDTMFGVTPITGAMAIALERIFNVPASFWNNLQANYDNQGITNANQEENATSKEEPTD